MLKNDKTEEKPLKLMPLPLVVGTDTKIELSFPSPAAGIIWAVCLDSKCQDDIVVIVDCNVCNVCNVDCPQQTDTSCQETFVQLLVSR